MTCSIPRAVLVLCACAWLLPSAISSAASPGESSRIRADRTALFDLVRVGSAFYAVGERGVVMRSTDEGRTWHGQQAPTTRTLLSIAVIDPMHGVAVGHGGTIVRTEDGARTFTAIPVEDAGSDSILGVTRLSDGRLVAYGAYGLYLESHDQGLTWKRRQVIDENFEWHIANITEVGHRLYLVGEAGTLAVSDDLGQTWARLESPYDGSFFGLLGLPDGALLAYGMRGNVFRSEDRGASWQQVPLATKSAINGGSIAADGRIVLVGNNGLIAVSKDAGRSFEMGVAPEGTPIARAAYADDGALVYVGYLATGRIESVQAAK